MFRAYAKKKLIQSGHRRRRPHLSYIDLATLMVAASISHFVTAATKFSCCSSNKNVSFVFYLSLQISVALFLFNGDSLAYRLRSLFLCLSLSLHSKSVDIKIKLSLILNTTRIQKQFPLSVFVFIDSLVVSSSKDADGYAISRQK